MSLEDAPPVVIHHLDGQQAERLLEFIRRHKPEYDHFGRLQEQISRHLGLKNAVISMSIWHACYWHVFGPQHIED